jgi:hypothetical protein
VQIVVPEISSLVSEDGAGVERVAGRVELEEAPAPETRVWVGLVRPVADRGDVGFLLVDGDAGVRGEQSGDRGGQALEFGLEELD